MALRLLILSFLLFVAGLGYLLEPNLILRIYAYLREKCLKDSSVLLSHRRIGISLILLALIVIGMAYMAQH